MQTSLFAKLLFLLVAILLGVSQELPAQDTEREAQHDVIGSIRSLREYFVSENRQKVAFDVSGQLTYCGHREIHLQTGKLALAIRMDPRMAERLSKLQIGALLRVQGVTLPSQRRVKAQHVSIEDPSQTIESSESGLEPGEKRAKILSYCSVTARVESILRRPGNTLVRLNMQNMDYAALYANIAESADNETLLSLLGKEVVVSGTLRQPQQGRYDLMVSDFRQLQETGRSRKDLDSLVAQRGWHVITGHCYYAEAKRALWLETESGELARAFRGFPDDVHYGDILRVYGRKSERQSAAAKQTVMTGMLIDVLDNRLPESIPQDFALDVETALTTPPLPSRVRVSGKVLNKRMSQGICIYLIDSQGVKTQAFVIASGRAGKREPDRGDVATFVGVPEWNRDKLPGEADLRLFVGRPEDAKIKVSPLLIDRKSLLTLIGIASLLLVGGLVWVQSLRSQVELRTQRLSAVTTHLEASFEAVQEAILLTDNLGNVVRVNTHFKSLFGFTPMVGSSADACIDSIAGCLADQAPLHKVVKSLASSNQVTTQSSVQLSEENRVLNIYASPITESNGTRHGCLWSFRDITNQRRLERELLQAQKMEAIGQLSGGVAHDFNNLLTVLSTNLSLLEDHVRESEPGTSVNTSEFSAPMEMAIQQGASLTRQLLGFARDSKLQVSHSDANQLVQRVYNLVHRTLDSTIQLSLVLEPKPLWIEVDETRLEQVLLNLCINARDAIDSHGAICLRTRLIPAPREQEQVVSIEVEDDGQGMRPATQQRVFEPFFTTKERSRGTGLGLSTALGVIEQLGGKIEFQSEWQKGTTFRISLPASQFQAASTGLLPYHEPQQNFVARHVLLVDDELALRTAGQTLLERLGHTVITAGNGREAIECLRENEHIEVVLLDLTMPEMTGIEACQYIRQQWPSLPVIICSGYSSMRLSPLDMDEQIEFLPKPFKASQLGSTIERATGKQQTRHDS